MEACDNTTYTNFNFTLMSKGFADMLVASARELDREIERDIKGIEVPYLEQGYRNWAVKYPHLESATIDKYVRHVKRADKEFFTSDEDFFELLQEKIKSGKFDEVNNLFDKYIAIITKWYDLSLKEELDLKSTTIRDWRSAFKSYRDFFIEYLIPVMKEKLGRSDENTKPIPEVEPKKKPILGEDRFVEWMQEEGMSYGSAHSYMSLLRGCNRDIFLKNKRGVDFLAQIPLYLHSKNPGAAIDMLNKLISILDGYLHGDSKTTPQRLHKISNYRAALSKYAKFINEEMIDVIPDEEITNATEVLAIEEEHTDSDSLAIFNYEDLENNFTFRFKTQNRMGENMHVFYPIDILRRLFLYSQKISEKNGDSNGNYNWFNRWVDDCVAKIEVITERKRYILADLDFLSVDAKNNKVEVSLLNSEDSENGLAVLTETDVQGASPVAMKVGRLKDIHIDHTPLISQVLVEQAANLPALAQLTEMIKTVARNHKLEILAKNFSAIGTKVFEDVSFSDMEQLIPALKEELKIIEANSTLTLMAAEYNLRKKK